MYNYQAARAAGLSDQQIEAYLKSKGRSLATETIPSPQVQNNPQPQKAQKKSNPLLDLLSIGGSILGGLLGAPGGPLGIVGGATLGGGAGEAGRQYFSGEEGDIGKVGKEAAFGGGGSLLGLGIGRLLGGGARVAGQAAEEFAPGGLKGIGQAMQKGVLNPKVIPSATAAKKEAQLLQKAKDLGLRGTAQAQRIQSAAKYEELDNLINSKFAQNNPKIDSNQATSILNKTFADNININLAKKDFQQLAASRIKQVGSLKDAKAVYDYKEKLSGSLSRAFSKIEKGTPLTNEEEVAMATWESMDNLLAEAAPQVKELTLAQSTLHKLAPGLQTSAAGANMPFGIGKIPVVTPAIQEAQSLFGRMGEGISNIGTKTGRAIPFGGIASQTAGQIGGRTLFGQEGEQNQTNQSQYGGSSIYNNKQPQEEGNNIQGQFNHMGSITDGSGFVNTPEMTLMGKPITRAQLARLMLENPKQASTLKTIFEFENPQLGSQKPLTADQQKTRASALSGLRAIGTIENQLNQDPSVLLKAALPGSPGARVFSTARREIQDVLTRLRTGAALNQDEMRFYAEQAPQPFDSQETINYKLNLFRDLFNTLANQQPAGNLPLPQDTSSLFGGL